MPLREKTARNGADKKRRTWLPGIARAGHPARDESEVRWLISYSDFMMQLVCLFILLYSVSSLDTTKASPIVQAWREEVGMGPVTMAAPAPLTGAVPLTRAEVTGLMREMQIILSRYVDGGLIRISETSDGFRLQLLYEMFDEGSAQLSRQGQRIVDVAALILQPYQYRVASIDVLGHAAAEEGAKEQGDAIRLSLDRARDAHKWMSRPEAPSRLDERALLAGGRGVHDPVEDNSNPRTRALNRQVDFVVRLR